MTRKKKTPLDILEAKEQSQKVVMITAYDYGSARLVDAAGADIILVGDSLAMVVLGHENTLSVTMEEMLHHTRAAAKGAGSCMVLADMPFLSYQIDAAQAVRNAGRFLKEAGASAVKLEGGESVIDQVRALVRAEIPVVGHLGLTPQSIARLGGFKVQSKTATAALRLIEEAKMLEEAGCFGLVLEAVPRFVAAEVTRRLSIPTIGIGAGPDCDGQVLVYHDILGLFDAFRPRFVKTYAEAGTIHQTGLAHFAEEVRSGVFPGDEHCFGMNEAEKNIFFERLEQYEF
ncbi:3-methyl-2-oxobutanoate hydroxymethyltransferase [Desulfovibrio inopinatus]|uniref:3-methyl-2-oxobutanoate hydroxymethyltransferase n=1 Tax=Desulfovibrio inopinatus TaxID=102109 RepID=UPI000411907B|nr:3-methyl-2-oxobutanoate hydroxymethyltransferase [Desulfovibrio inopinatus]